MESVLDAVMPLLLMGLVFGPPAFLLWWARSGADVERRALEGAGFTEEGEGWKHPELGVEAVLREQITLRGDVQWRGPVVRTGVGNGIGDDRFDTRFAVDWSPGSAPILDEELRRRLQECALYGEVRLDEAGIHLLLPPREDADGVRRAAESAASVMELLASPRTVDQVIAEEPHELATRALQYVWRRDPERARRLAREHGRPGPTTWNLWWASLAGDVVALVPALGRAIQDVRACVEALGRLPLPERWQAMEAVGQVAPVDSLTDWVRSDDTPEAPERARAVLHAWSQAGPPPGDRDAVAWLWDLARPALVAEDVEMVAWAALRMQGSDRCTDAVAWILGVDRRAAVPALRRVASGTTGYPRAKAEEAIDRLKEAYGASGALSVVEPKGGELSIPDDERRRAHAAARRDRSREP